MKALNDIPWHSDLAIILRMDRHPIRPPTSAAQLPQVRQSPNLRFLPNRSDSLAPRSIDGHDVLVRALPRITFAPLLSRRKLNPKLSSHE